MKKNENDIKKERLAIVSWGTLCLWLLNFYIADNGGVLLAFYTILFYLLPLLSLAASIWLILKYRAGVATLVLSSLALLYLLIGSYMALTFD